jgi:hypothetical protein
VLEPDPNKHTEGYEMNSNDKDHSADTSLRGTPLDYASEMYRVYFEVGEHEGKAKKIIEEYLGPERSETLTTLSFGYECEMAIQCVPDIVGELARNNIGVYQVVRYAKTRNIWI